MNLRKVFAFFALFTLLAVAAFAVEPTRHAAFTHFAVDLPPEWDGDEQTGFISDSSDEYVLTLGRKDGKGDKFLAQVSIYLLPNKPGATAEAAARTLAEAQGYASEPVKSGNFWQFTGEPRSRTIRGMATTMVNTTPERMLIIIAHDPQNLGAARIVESLSGVTPQAREMLGR